MGGVVRFALRHSRRVIGAWIAVAAVCGLLGLASGNPFAPTTVIAPGTESERWYDLTTDADFGANINILLTGPRREMHEQGEALASRLRDSSHVRVVSPFDDTPASQRAQREDSLQLLRRNSALLLANVPFRSGEEPAATLVPIRAAIRATVHPPITSRITGVPAVAEGISDETYAATRKAELLSVPLLMIVLLLIFRSPVAAAVPLILGLGTTVAAGGLVKAIATQAPVDQIAVTMASMMALALGVDYSLLLVSRYREHRRAEPGSVHRNVEAASQAAGRTIAFAAVLLISVMCSAAALAVGPIMASAALGFIVATVFGALTAIFVAPALLKEIDPWLERWQVPWRSRPRATRFASRHPVLIPLFALFGLLVLAAPTLGIETGAPDVKILPEKSPARIDYEEIGKVVGPGAGAVFNVLIQSRDGQPLTTERSLAAITRVQDDLAADPGIDSVLGPAELNGIQSQLPAMKRGLTGQPGGMARLDRGLSRAARGSRSAGDGANSLHTASGDAKRGSSDLAEGIGDAERGSSDLAEGIGSTNSGSVRAAQGAGRLSAGASKLSEQVEDARSSSASISNRAEVLKSDLQDGSEQLEALQAPVSAVEANLADVWQALEAMTTGRGDPQFQAALEAARAANEVLTGADPDNGDQLNPAYAGVASRIADAKGQVDLGIYLSNRLDKLGQRTQDGVGKLAEAAGKVDAGASRVSAANVQLADGLARLAGTGPQLPEGLRRLFHGANRLSAGISQIGAGAGRLSANLGDSTTSGQLTSGLDRMQAAVADQRRDSDSQSGQLDKNSPRLFKAGMMPLAIVSGAQQPVRERTQFVLDTAHSGRTAQITAFPEFATSDPRIDGLRKRIAAISHQIDRPEFEVAVGGPGAMLEDYTDAATARLPVMVVAFILISLLILLFAIRAVPLAALCVVLNLLTVGVTLGVMQLGFGSENPLLGGPGYVDIIGLGLTLAVVFALSIDYQVFLLARIREEYVASGSNDRALTVAIGSTAGIITGAAAVMVVIFLTFCVSSYIGIRQIGVGLALAIFLDATVVRLVLLPAGMRLIGDRVWWFPGWLDRRLPNVSL